MGGAASRPSQAMLVLLNELHCLVNPPVGVAASCLIRYFCESIRRQVGKSHWIFRNEVYGDGLRAHRVPGGRLRHDMGLSLNEHMLTPEQEAVVRAIRSKNSAQASAEMRRHILCEGQRMGIFAAAGGGQGEAQRAHQQRPQQWQAFHVGFLVRCSPDDSGCPAERGAASCVGHARGGIRRPADEHRDRDQLAVEGGVGGAARHHRPAARDGGQAAEIAAQINNIEKEVKVPVGALDVSLHRDDIGMRPVSLGAISNIPFDLSGATVVVVDDVLYTGRTVRAAMEGLNNYGRPRAVQLAVLVDRGHRELPIRPDFVGKNLPTHRGDEVSATHDGVFVTPNPEGKP